MGGWMCRGTDFTTRHFHYYLHCVLMQFHQANITVLIYYSVWRSDHIICHFKYCAKYRPFYLKVSICQHLYLTHTHTSRGIFKCIHFRKHIPVVQVPLFESKNVFFSNRWEAQKIRKNVFRFICIFDNRI